MRYEIVLAPEANNDLKRLSAPMRAWVRKLMETHLRHSPEMISKSRIKRLRGMRRPQYRLRIDDMRIYYDVSGNQVEVLAIVSKEAAALWLEEKGSRE
ncbi:MAG: type II toxin-antitoxin system RelE/ParE family toxin [Acidimicrobiia bacterium]|nr:type II toxin-antitoxin system RelE/ParE family toxin [Acidimicrobiia bacterium]